MLRMRPKKQTPARLFLHAALLLAAVPLLLCGPWGCGRGKDGGAGKPPTPQEEVVDSFLRALASGNEEALLSALPPDSVEAILGDLTTLSREELASVLLQALRHRFPCAGIGEVHYRTEERGEGSAVVYYWGTFEMVDDGGTTSSWEIPEADAHFFPLVQLEGRWHLDIWTR